jgi:hypothetical protein
VQREVGSPGAERSPHRQPVTKEEPRRGSYGLDSASFLKEPGSDFSPEIPQRGQNMS